MNQVNIKQHWESVYTEKSTDAVSWYQQTPTISLAIIRSLYRRKNRVIDIGAGASLLVDHLVQLGDIEIALLDISGKALDLVKQRLKDQANQVTWYEQDITHCTVSLPSVDIWHDRAVFHFLTDKPSRDSYLTLLKKTLKPGGHVIIATFAKDGPKKCSGLDVVQYDNESIQQALGEAFILLSTQPETHITPMGNEQRFIYFVLQRK